MVRRRLARLARWLLGMLLGILGLLVAATQLPVTRRLIAREVLDWLGRTYQLQLSAGEVRRLDPWGVELHQVSASSASLGLFGTVADLSVSLRPFDLLHAEVRLTQVRVAGLRLQVLMQEHEEPSKAPAPAPTENAWRISVEDLQARDLLAQVSGLGPDLELYVEDLDASGTWSEHPEVSVARARMQLTRAGNEAVTLSLLSGHYSLRRGGALRVEGLLAAAPFALNLSLAPWEDRLPWYVSELRLRLGGVNRETLAGLGLGESVRLRGQVDLGLAGHRAGPRLELVSVVHADAASLLARALLTPETWDATLDLTARPLAALADSLPKLDVQASVSASYHPNMDPQRLSLTWKDLNVGNWTVPAGSMQLRASGPEIRLQDLRFQRLQRTFSLDARYQTQTGEVRARVALQQLELGALQPQLPLPARGLVDGNLELRRSAAGAVQLSTHLIGSGLRVRDQLYVTKFALEADLHGALSRPVGELSLALEGLETSELQLTKANLQASSDGTSVEAMLNASGPQADASVTASARLGDHGQVTLTASGEGGLGGESFWFRLRELSKTGEHIAWRGLHLRSRFGELLTHGELSPRQVRVELSALGVPLSYPGPVDALASIQAYPRLGHASAALTAWGPDGSEARTEAALKFRAPFRNWQQLIRHGELSAHSNLRLGPDLAEARLQVGPKEGHLVLVAADALGELLHFQGDARGDLSQLSRARSLQRLLALLDVNVSAHLAPRDLADLQAAVGRLAARYHFAVPMRARGDLSLTSRRGHTSGTLRLLGALDVPRVDPRCKPGTRLDLAVEAELSADGLVARASAAPTRGGPVDATLRVPIRVRDGTPIVELKASHLHAQGHDLSLAEVPYLCGLGAGRGALQVDALHLGTPQLEAHANVLMDELKLHGDTQTRLSAEASLNPSRALLESSLNIEGTQRAFLQAHFPVKQVAGAPKLSLAEPLELRLRIDQLPVGLPLHLTPEVGRTSGSVSADVKLSGTLQAPSAHGYIAFNDVSFSVASLAQPFRKLNGRLELQGDTLVIPELSASDRGGKVSLSGKAKLARHGEGTAKLQLKADRFPLRQQGIIMGRLTLRSELSARLHNFRAMTLDAQIAKGRLDLATPRTKEVQSLDPHPDVHLVGERRGAGPAASSFQLTGFQLHTQKDLQLKHRDFSLQVGLDLAYVQVQNKPQLFGAAHIHRGIVEFFGKSLNIMRGEVRFTGELPADPEFDLRASYSPGSGQEQLIVQVGGRASNPVLSFSGAAASPEEALAVLSGSNTSEARNTAQANAQSLALGITAGILSMTARRELGEWVPMISVTSSPNTQTSQASAGFNASSLIPSFMRGFARGAYVEGVVGPTTSTPGSSLGLGVRLEIALPRSVLSRFTYGPGTAWSSDVVWTP